MPFSTSTADSPSIRASLWRGAKKICPRCGVGRMFRGFYDLVPDCSSCRLRFHGDPADHLGLMYITAAVQNAMFACFVLLFDPPSPWLARGALIAVAVGVMFLNMPNRKGLAIALDYLTERNTPPDPGSRDRDASD